MKNNSYNIDRGDWAEIDKTTGQGRGSFNVQVDAWQGREDRSTLRVVYSDVGMKALTIRHKGIKVNNISVDRIDFPIGGGDRQIMVETNYSSIKALLTSDKEVRTRIKSFTTASGLNIDVNDKSLDYGFPGDPGLEGVFQLSLIVSASNNSGGEEINENITINGKLIKVYQPGIVKSYLNFERGFDEVSSNQTNILIPIVSNLDNYTIEIEECYEDTTTEIKVSPNVVNLNVNGDAETVNVETNPQNLSWEIRRK